MKQKQPWFESYIGTSPAYQPPDVDLKELIPREKEVLVLLAKGLNPREAASQMLHADGKNLSRHTVNTYRKSLYRKLGADNRVALTKIAIAAGLISLPTGDDLHALENACSNLTDRQWKAFEQISQEKTDKEAGKKLGINHLTFRDHKKIVYEALKNFKPDGMERKGSNTKATIAWIALKMRADELLAQKKSTTDTSAEPPTTQITEAELTPKPLIQTEFTNKRHGLGRPIGRDPYPGEFDTAGRLQIRSGWGGREI